MAKKLSDGSLCLICEECLSTVDDPKQPFLHIYKGRELEVLGNPVEEWYSVLEGDQVIPPTQEDIVTHGWEYMKVHYSDEPSPVLGGECVCSKRIAWDGAPVLRMYREEPNGTVSSGWHFYSFETAEEMEDPDSFQIAGLMTVFKQDSSVHRLLIEKAPCSFVRESIGQPWVRDPNWRPPYLTK